MQIELVCVTMLLHYVLLTMAGTALGAEAGTVPATAKAETQHADSAEIANHIVQHLQALGNHKMFPSQSARSAMALHAVPNFEGGATYYEPAPDYYKLEPAEPTMDPNLTPSGINVNGALGFISYLVLLVLLQSAVEGVASRAPSRRRRRGVSPSPEDLLGRALDMQIDPMGPISSKNMRQQKNS